MILVDTSVVIDYSRSKDKKLQALLLALPVSVCGVTRAELLCGTRDSKHRLKLLTTLSAFQFLTIPDALWDTAGDNLAALRRAGITVPFADVVIASLAIDNDIELWARDPHFVTIQKTLPALQLFQEPP